MTNTISRKDTPDLFNILLEHFDVEFNEFEHKRGSMFYVTRLIEVMQTDLDEMELNDRIFGNIEGEWISSANLLGFWETNTCIWSDEDGFGYPPDTLYRVKPVQVLTTKYEKVIDAPHD